MNRRGRVGSVGRSAPFTHDQLKLVRVDFDRQEPLRGADGFLIECRAGRGRRAAQPGLAADDDELRRLRQQAATTSRSSCATASSAATRTCAPATCCAATARRTTTSSTASATRSAGRARTSPPPRSPSCSTARRASARPPSTACRSRTPTAAPAWRSSSSRPGRRFDPAAYYAFAEKTLPAYARPLFVRIAPAMDVTGTLKHVKSRLQREGYDPATVGDPLFFRDDAARTYVRSTRS